MDGLLRGCHHCPLFHCASTGCLLRCTAPAGVEKDYEQASYFSTSHPSCMFGVPADTSSIKRRLAERVHVAFPLHFSSVQPKRLPQASSGAQPRLRSLLGASLRVNPMAV